MILSYMYVPMMLKYLGTEKYGIWATILTLLSWISQFDIGIGNGLRNKLAESLSRKDERSRTLVSSAYAFIIVLMIGITLVFSVIAYNLNWERIFGVTDVSENLSSIVVLSIIFVTINFVLSICKNVLYALQRAAYVSIIELITQIITIVGLFFAMNYGKNGSLFTMSMVYGSSMLIVNIVASILLYSKNKKVRPSIRKVEFSCGKELTKIGMQFFVIQICALILFTTDSLIISYLYGASDVTPYSTVNKIFNVILIIYTAVLTPIWSAVSKAKALNDWKRVNNLLMRLYVIIIPFIFGCVALVIIFKPLSAWWLKQELNYENGLIIFGALYCILSMWCNMHSTFTNGLGILKIPQIVALIQATINIPLSLFLAKIVGMNVTGVLAGTVLTMFIPSIVLPIITNNRIKREIKNKDKVFN